MVEAVFWGDTSRGSGCATRAMEGHSEGSKHHVALMQLLGCLLWLPLGLALRILQGAFLTGQRLTDVRAHGTGYRAHSGSRPHSSDSGSRGQVLARLCSRTAGPNTRPFGKQHSCTQQSSPPALPQLTFQLLPHNAGRGWERSHTTAWYASVQVHHTRYKACCTRSVPPRPSLSDQATLSR